MSEKVAVGNPGVSDVLAYPRAVCGVMRGEKTRDEELRKARARRRMPSVEWLLEPKEPIPPPAGERSW